MKIIRNDTYNNMTEEKTVEQREKVQNVKKIVLASLAIGGILTVAVLAPNALQALGALGVGKKKWNARFYINTVINKLVKDGLIRFEGRGDGKCCVLTEKGERRLARYQLQEFSEKEFPKWDGKWRIIIFDIKEYSRAARDNLRRELQNAGFVKLQNSVWVFPHDCEEFVFLLKTSFELGKSVLYMTVEKLENDSWLRKQFGLLSDGR